MIDSGILITVLLNFAYAGIGGLMCVPLMIIAYKLFNKYTPAFHIGDQLKNGNVAVGIVVGCLLLGIAICTGLVVGLGLN
jgi:uncharacterized membrane protein YjfL (UPF0719 family)